MPPSGSTIPDGWLPLVYAAAGLAATAILAWRWRAVGADVSAGTAGQVVAPPRAGTLGAPS